MPYISQQAREVIDSGFHSPGTAGELNYAISKMINTYLRVARIDYAALNEVIGVLECAKLELYRRIAAPYEDSKMNKNGDVYI